MAILKTTLLAAVLASPLAAPVIDWVTDPGVQAVSIAPAYVPPPVDLGKLAEAFRH